MDTQTAVHLVTQTFEADFDAARFRTFARNLLNAIDESKAFGPLQGAYIWESYRDHVHQYWRVGTYTDPDGEKIDVLIVRLKKSSALERARTMQRNFVARYLKERDAKDAALVAYYTDDTPDWRFSLVKMEYQVEVGETGVKVKEVLTPARRYSFLVGANEPNHTAQQQLVPLLKETRHNPTLAQLEAAFNIESVTHEFFEKYKALFLDLKEELDALVDANPAIQAEFDRAGIATANFAKKLLGQLVFLTFLQKKGWLGVAPGAPWGSGPQDFLRRLFAGDEVRYDNFFNEVLEPLFYEALAIERPDHYDPRLDCRVPFLNGGLFEPVGGYDWRGVDIPLSNARFDAIFSTFELYNFTVREDEPFEKEVAVDPEMLGKVFENLLDVQDRKSKGAFYTPREIVHYMCQESLINYLDTTINTPLNPPARGGTEGGIPREDLDTLIRQGEMALEHDAATAAKPHETEAYAFALPAAIREHAAALDAALAEIKICDPAIGSGAFPVGMMHEIVKARTVLTTYLADLSGFQNPKGLEARTPYALKRQAIQNALYGVDIDPGAVDIAKLRLWLSLVVDEESYDDIQPLPNLEYKIVCGNALLGFPETWQSPATEKVERLKRAYFSETDPARKASLRAQIDAAMQQHLANAEKVIGYPVDFDFRLFFSEVFHDKGGFDVVIGNPPYVRHERIRDQKPALKEAHPQVYRGTADLYVYFYSQGLNILHPRGFLAFITSNKFMRAGYGKKLRRFLTQKATPRTVIDFGDLPVFDATAYPCIVMAQKAPAPANNIVRALTVESVPQIRRITQVMAQQAWPMPQHKALTANSWRLEPPEVLNLLEKLRQSGTPLDEYLDNDFYRGVTTGLNKAFVIDSATRERLIQKDARSAEIIKRWIRGRDIDRWQINIPDQHVIFTRRGIDIDEYPAIKEYLTNFKERLEPGTPKGRKSGAYKWYEIQDSTSYYEEFEKPKIVYPDIAKSPEFAYDTRGVYGGNTMYIMPTKDLSMLGILNSSVVEFFYTQTSSTIRGDYLRFIATYISRIPIPQPSDPTPIETLVRRILAAKAADPAADVSALEAEIDRLAYQLYGLTEDEIAIIEETTEA